MTDERIDLTPVAVYVPAGYPGTLGSIEPGSGIVGSAERGRVTIDYEGGIYRDPADRGTLADRCHIAWGRHLISDRFPGRYPTVARASVPVETVVQVGTYDPREGELTFTDADALGLVAQWLGLTEPGASTAEQDLAFTLAAQRLTTTTVRHQQRRELRQAIAARTYPPQLLRQFARQWHCEDLIDNPTA